MRELFRKARYDARNRWLEADDMEVCALTLSMALRVCNIKHFRLFILLNSSVDTIKLLIMIPAAAFSLILGLFMIFITDAVIIFMVVLPLFLDLISLVIRPVILSEVLYMYIRIGATMMRVVMFPWVIRWRLVPVIIAV